jgi:hypothetical protein
MKYGAWYYALDAFGDIGYLRVDELNNMDELVNNNDELQSIKDMGWVNVI